MFSWMFWLLHLILEQSDVLLIEKIIWLVSKDVSPLYFILSFPKLSLLRRHKAAFKGEFGSYRIVTKIPKYPMSALGWSWLEVFYHIFYLIWSKFFFVGAEIFPCKQIWGSGSAGIIFDYATTQKNDGFFWGYL